MPDQYTEDIFDLVGAIRTTAPTTTPTQDMGDDSAEPAADE
ncbi:MULTISPECIES: hypothetical protein [Streptomyces]|nr:hypothetical protein [Streptomyces kasugaensis]